MDEVTLYSAFILQIPGGIEPEIDDDSTPGEVVVTFPLTDKNINAEENPEFTFTLTSDEPIDDVIIRGAVVEACVHPKGRTHTR